MNYRIANINRLMSLNRFYLILVTIVLFLSACENDMAEIQRQINEEEITLERAIDVEMLYSDSAVVKVRIIAPEMLNYLDKKEPKREFQKGMQVDVFDERQNIVSKITAKYAVQLEKEDKIVLKDSVRVVTSKNETLSTEEMTWDEKSERVFCGKDTYVSMKTQKETIEGYGFDSNLDFTKWKISNVTGVIQSGIMEDAIR